MSVILNALPYLNREYRLQTSNRGVNSYLIRQNQIVCWACLTSEGAAWVRQDNLSMFPVVIDFSGGIEVFNDPVNTSFPRLPLLGMRALHVSQLELTINAAERQVFLRQLSS